MQAVAIATSRLATDAMRTRQEASLPLSRMLAQPALEPDACRTCHGRMNKEAQLQLSDVHFDDGMVCSKCHSSDEVHGDGNQYDSMFSPGAMDTKCENCHTELSDNAEHNQHGADFHCDACHLETVITCYNCHFETLLKAHKKKAAGAFKDYIILLNDKNGKVRAGTYQSVVYEDKTFVAFGPYHGHVVTADGRTCKNCHNSERMLEEGQAHQGCNSVCSGQVRVPVRDPRW
jgi:hypothetical protein